MTEFGYFLSCEEHGPRAILAQAQRAEAAGFRTVSISDHYHPWMESQGESPFVWSVIGGIAATTRLEVTTGVTCPTFRIHPAVMAHAAATASVSLGGRFRFAVGTGERLNEHILGQHWPPSEIRREMLVEAIELMRELWKGEAVTRHGKYFTTENARIFTTPPDGSVPVPVSAFGPAATDMAAEIADGFVSTSPDAENLRRYHDNGGKGPAISIVKVCWAADEEQAKKEAHRLWAASGVPGESSQELSMPSQFEQAAQLVTPDDMAEKMPCGPDPERHLATIKEHIDAGFDEVHLGQIGDDQEGFLRFWERELKPRL